MVAAEPALAIFFGKDSYEKNQKMHESFWSAHLNRVSSAGVLLGAKLRGEWVGFRCFYPPGRGREPYNVSYVGSSLLKHVE